MMGSISVFVFGTAQFIYKNNRSIVDALVKLGRIRPSAAEVEFALRVAKDFQHYGLQLPKKLARLIK